MGSSINSIARNEGNDSKRSSGHRARVGRIDNVALEAAKLDGSLAISAFRETAVPEMNERSFDVAHFGASATKVTLGPRERVVSPRGRHLQITDGVRQAVPRRADHRTTPIADRIEIAGDRPETRHRFSSR
ncbi:MAG TPA: hypothetical protein VJ891_00900 [Casimicrobiaceae bacterium]|nr:hypothetical protein [Casimicrobiaceae bacterium]